MRQLFLIWSLCLLLAGNLIAQGDAVRIEFEAEIEGGIYQIEPVDKKGILIFFETLDNFDEQSKLWLFSRHDGLFNQTWLWEVPVVMGADYHSSYREGDKLHLFFLNNRRVKTATDNFHIITYDMAIDTFFHIRGEVPEKSTFADFVVHDNIAVVGLNQRKEQAMVFFVDLYTGQLTERMINIEDQNEIENITVMPDNAGINVLVSNYRNHNQNMLLFFEFSIGGDYKTTREVQSVLNDKYLNTAKVFYPKAGEMILIGSYNNNRGKLGGEDSFNEIESAGFFMTRFLGDKQEYINYYNFLEFKNLKTGLSGKDYYKLQKKMKKANAEFSMSYQLLLHDIIEMDGQYVMTAESYYPDFRTVNDVTYDYWGRPVQQSYTVFEGFRYINVVLAGFNPEGEMAWDNSMEIYNINTYELDQKIKMLVDDGFMVLYYNEAGKIAYKVIDREDVVEGLTHTEIALSHGGDKITESGYDNIIPWYNNYFLVYGYQTVKNNKFSSKPRRTVFYVNKLALE